MANYRLIATQVGDLLKYDTTLRQIDRLAKPLFCLQEPEQFPNDDITSVRAKLFYDWVLTLAKRSMIPQERDALVVRFCRGLAPDDKRKAVDAILIDAGIELPDVEDQVNRAAAEKREAEAAALREAELAEFRRRADALLQKFDELVQQQFPQSRGYALQDLLGDLFALHRIPVIGSFTRNEGAEQIDGAFRLNGWYYIVECR